MGHTVGEPSLIQNTSNGLWVDRIASSMVVDPNGDSVVGVRLRRILAVAIRALSNSVMC
jgi:hypothetical protein